MPQWACANLLPPGAMPTLDSAVDYIWETSIETRYIYTNIVCSSRLILLDASGAPLYIILAAIRRLSSRSGSDGLNCEGTLNVWANPVSNYVRFKDPFMLYAAVAVRFLFWL